MSEWFREFGLLQRMDGVSGGAVCLRDSGVMVEFLAGLFAAGESIDFIAKQYRRSRDEIEAAIRIVVLARGHNLDEKRAKRVVERHIPLLRGRSTSAKRSRRSARQSADTATQP
jgi:uncharacterized protein (DUF433 family)